MPELSVKQSTYFSNSTFSYVSLDDKIIFILIRTFLHKKLWNVIKRLNEGAVQILSLQKHQRKNSTKALLWKTFEIFLEIIILKTWATKFTRI